MRNTILIALVVLLMGSLTSCNVSGGGGGGYGGSGYTDYEDDWDYWDDDDYYDDWDDDDWDDDYYDDWDDWDDWDDDWDDDGDGCWDCGDDWGWYDDSQQTGETHSTDIMGDVAEKEQARLGKASEYFASKFNLSADQGLKIAKTISDFNALEKRDASDLAEFSQKLYGLNPEEIVTAISSAQVGDHRKLDSAVEQAAKNFNTTSDNMRQIIRDLHGSALRENGIQL